MIITIFRAIHLSFPLILSVSLAQYFVCHICICTLWSQSLSLSLRILFTTTSMFHVTRFFYILCLLLSLKPFSAFLLGPFSPSLSISLSLSSSGILWGTVRKRMPLSASFFSWCAPRLIPAFDLRIVHPIARLFPRGSHWYQDPNIRITSVPPFTVTKDAGQIDDLW